jgi:hypothetical protein
MAGKKASARGAVGRVLGSWRRAMRRIISLYLQHWPSVTAIVIRRWHNATEKAEASGLSRATVGMTVTHAQSLIPNLTVSEATPEEDEAALFRLALWCIKYSPLVTPDPPDGKRCADPATSMNMAETDTIGRLIDAGENTPLSLHHRGHVSRRSRAAARPLPQARL